MKNSKMTFKIKSKKKLIMFQHPSFFYMKMKLVCKYQALAIAS